MSNIQDAQRFSDLQQRQNSANSKIQQYQFEYKSISDQLQQLWKEVEDQYSVNNIEDLRKLYTERKQQRDQKLQTAIQSLEEVEAILAGIDQALQSQK